MLRFGVARATEDRVIVFARTTPGLLPAGAVDVPGDGPAVAAPALDPRRACLWSLAATVEREPGVYGTYPYDLSEGTTDDRGERPQVAYDGDPDHHLLVFDGELTPALRAALERGAVEEAAPGAYVTRVPARLAEVQRWVDGGTLVAAFPGASRSMFELSIAYDSESAFDFVVNMPGRPTPRAELPAEWRSALEGAEPVDVAGHEETLALEVICAHARAIDAEGGRPPDADRLEAEFEQRRARHLGGTRSDPWPTGVVTVVGFELPETGAGRTVEFTRRLVAGDLVVQVLTLAAVVGLGWIFVKWMFVSVPTVAHAYLVVATALASAVVARLNSPRRVRIGRDRVIVSTWWSRRELAVADAAPAVTGLACGHVVAARRRAAAEGWTRPRLAVTEWLEDTRTRGPGGSTPARSVTPVCRRRR